MSDLDRRASRYLRVTLLLLALSAGLLSPLQFARSETPAAAPASVTLAADGVEACPIFVRPDAAPGEKQAAAELARYLGAITGKPAAAVSAWTKAELPERGILVGPVAIAELKLPDDLADQGFVVRTRKGCLQFAGLTPEATQIAVYSFLEDDLGCRWWAHDAEDVKKQPTVRVALDRVVRPPLDSWSLDNHEATLGAFRYKRRAVGPVDFTGGHNLYTLMAKYGQSHPEIYPDDGKGKRAANDLHLCYSAPGLAEALAETLAAEVEQHKRDLKHYIYFAGMGDWYGGMCHCPRCEAIYAEETWTNPDGKPKPGYTGTLLRMINRAAEILDARYPGIRVGTFAYMSLEAPPAKTRPQANVAIWVPRLRHCTVHAVGECENNRDFELNLKRWCEITPGGTYVWEYGIDFDNFFWPLPCVRSLADNIRSYAHQGVRGVRIQGNYVSTGGDLCLLKNYVWGRLIWNSQLKTQALIDEFCQGYGGPAGAELLEYVNALEDAVRKHKLAHADEFATLGKLQAGFLSDDLLKRLRDIRARAIAKTAGNEIYQRRVKEMLGSIEAADLWKPGPLEEHGNQLWRADLGAYTFDRLQDFLKFSREASPREFGSGRAYRMALVPLHGGPLTTLKRGELEVKVASVVGGQIRQIGFQGHPLLHLAAPQEKEYPKAGGILSRLEPHSQFFLPDGDATATSMAMKAETGVGNWSPETKQTVRLRVELPADRQVLLVGEVRRPSSGGVEQISGKLSTAYEVGKDLAGLRVEALIAPKDAKPASADADQLAGTWQPVTLDAKTPQAKIENARALRLSWSKSPTILDEYLTPLSGALELSFDARLGVLETLAPLQAQSAPRDQDAIFLKRRISLSP